MDVKYPERVLELMELVRSRIMAQIESPFTPATKEELLAVADRFIEDTKKHHNLGAKFQVKVQVIDDYRIRFDREGVYLLLLSEGVEAARHRFRTARQAKRAYNLEHKHSMIVHYNTFPLSQLAQKVHIDPATEKPDVPNDVG